MGKTADVLRDQLENHGILLDSKEKNGMLRTAVSARSMSLPFRTRRSARFWPIGRQRAYATTIKAQIGSATSLTSSACLWTTRKTDGTHRTAGPVLLSRSLVTMAC